jgi:hypothetical protein
VNISKLKKLNLLVLDVADTKVVWFIDPVEDPVEIVEKIPEGTNLVLVHPAKPFASAADADLWDLAAQKIKREKNVVLVYSSGEYQVQEVHMRGSSLDPMVHYVLDTPDGRVGFFQKEPSDTFIKQYTPIDVLVGLDMAVAGIQLDLEPFSVVLPILTEEYKKKSGVSEIKEVDHVNIKKVSQEDREGAVTMNVYALG